MRSSLLRRLVCIVLGHRRGGEWADSGRPYAVGENGQGRDHYHVHICRRCGELWREVIRPDPIERVAWRRPHRRRGYGEPD